MKKLLLALVAVVAFANVSNAQVAIKTNLLYWGVGAANGGLEIGLAPKWTIDLNGYGFLWGYDRFEADGWFANGEVRYYLCEKFNGHHFGVYGGYNHLDKVLLNTRLFKVLGKEAANGYINRENARGFSVGVSWGYYLKMNYHWAFDFNVGLGIMRYKFDSYNRFTGQQVGKDQTKTMLDLSNFKISLAYKF